MHTPQTVKALLKDKEVQKAIGDRCKTYRQSLINQGYIKADNQKFLCVFASYGSRYPLGLRETFFMREQLERELQQAIAECRQDDRVKHAARVCLSAGRTVCDRDGIRRG